MKQSSREKLINRCQALATLMDARFQIPGTRWRFGLDPLLGLIPGFGDLIGLIVAFYIVYCGFALRLPATVLARMLLNIFLDWLIGLIPVVGDAADIAIKANTKNVALLRKHVPMKGEIS